MFKSIVKANRWKEASMEACEEPSPCSKTGVGVIEELLGSFRIYSYCSPSNKRNLAQVRGQRKLAKNATVIIHLENVRPNDYHDNASFI